jgi:SMI1 / KNR4 family (SUKH-1)
MGEATRHAKLKDVEAWAGVALPEHYRAFLLEHPSGIEGDLVRLYAIGDVIERNETYETKKYCPGFIAIGDDSGGQAIVVAFDDEAGAVFLVDHGAMTRDSFHLIAPDFRRWLEHGCSLPDD